VPIGRVATSASVYVTGASSVAICGGLEEATDDRIISVVPVTGAAVASITGTTEVVAKDRNSDGVGWPVSSLKVASRLRETGGSVTSTEAD
jgi:hypothetical protein